MSESQVSISSFEVTKNPFESDIEEKLNYPGFSPSMFVTQKTPVNNRKKKEFRWSIEQISRLYPADVDEFPNQEYSSTYERPEDEKAEQEAIEEYFSQDAIVPSPWTPNRSAKKVTFSPLPPDMQYIPGNDCSLDSTVSQNNSMNARTTDACTQTLWSIPFNAVQLDEILGKAFNAHMHNTSDDSRNISNSSLRRKLFPINEQAHMRIDSNNNQSSEANIRSILKTSRSPVLATSSPLSSKGNQRRDTLQWSESSCPDFSPIKISPLNKQKQSQFLDSPARVARNSPAKILESSGIEMDLLIFPDISPIKDNPGITNEENSMSTTEENEQLESDMLQSTENVDEEDDSDDEKPAKITMEDLALHDNSDETEEDLHKEDIDSVSSDDNDDKPPCVTMEDLSTPNDTNNSLPPNLTTDDLSIPAEREKKIADTTENEAMDISLIANPPSITRQEIAPSETSTYNRNAYTPSQHYSEFDEDLVMVKAAAAIRRANRLNKDNYYTSNNYYELPSSSDFSVSHMNMSELPWQPVNMSTPVNGPTRARVYGSSIDNDYSSTRWCDSGVHNGTKRLSPVMEDVLRRQGVLKATLKEVQSDSWMKTVSPPNHTSRKWRTPRSYPLSNTERKALYGRPSRVPEYIDSFSPQLYNNDMLRYESKRLSWPPVRSMPLRASTRPLSPTHKVYSTHPEGSVSRMPIPPVYTSNSMDSGFDEWKKTINRYERSMKMQDIRLTPFYY